MHFGPPESPAGNAAETNSLRLRGEGRLIANATTLSFEGKRGGFDFGLRGAPQIALANVANVEYNPESRAILIRTRDAKHHVLLWASSREQADAIYALLPHETTPEFLADRAHHERFSKHMTALGGRAPVTPTLIGLNVAVFIAMLFAGAGLTVPDPSVHIHFGSNYGPLTWSGEYWRLLASAFIHFGILHIALNMYALYQAGGLVERLYGSARFALIYLLAALAGSVASGWWGPYRNSAGASGAIFGVYGALLAFMLIRRSDLPPSMLKSIGTSAGLFCIYSLAIGAAHPVIDNACHVGGLSGGFVAGCLLARPFTATARAKAQPMRLLMAAAAVILPLIWLAQPLVSNGQQRAATLRWDQDLEQFGPIEERLLGSLKKILTFAPNAPVDRVAIAKRLREEVLEPWQAASRPLLTGATLPQDDSRPARLQEAMRDYLRAREKSIALRAHAFETATEEDEAASLVADAELARSLNRFNGLAREGN